MVSIQELHLRLLARLNRALLAPVILDVSAYTVSIGPSIALADRTMILIRPFSVPTDPTMTSLILPQTSWPSSGS